jgi:cob(I)alamin adenosyltransferase
VSKTDPFNEPNLTLGRIYTRGGDQGETSLVGGQRIGKDSLRLEVYGTVDELLSVIGLACVSAAQHPEAELKATLLRVQHELFNLGSIMATMPQDVRPKQPRITQEDIDCLEREMDECNKHLPALKSFVLPGGCRMNAELHLARTVCRRAERLAVGLSRVEEVPEEAIRYLNRLSDALFVWSRWVNYKLGLQEVLWQPNKAASGS